MHSRGRVIERTPFAAPSCTPFPELAMRDVDVVRLLRDDGDTVNGEAGAPPLPKTPENVTSERMADDAPAWEDARAAKANGDAHFKVRVEPLLDRCRARVHLGATRPEPRAPRDRPASTVPPVSRDGPPPTLPRRTLFASFVVAEKPPVRSGDPQAGRFADADVSYGRALLLLKQTRGVEREKAASRVTNDDRGSDASFLEASTLSNRALAARRLARFGEALDDAARARRTCEKRVASEARFERLAVKTMCTQADALVNLGRAWDACGVLRSALRRLARSVQRTSAEGPMDPEEKRVERRNGVSRDVATVRARLRETLERVPMAVLCDHWASAIESATVQSDARDAPSPLSARQSGRLMRPAAVGRERRATTAESSRRLRDALAGAEPRWRAFTAEAWIRACAASATVSAPLLRRVADDVADAARRTDDRETKEDMFPFGTGAGAQFALHRARALVYRGKGDVAQFARDARTSAAYAPLSAPTGKEKGKEALSLSLTLPVGLDPANLAFASESPAVSIEPSASATRDRASASARLAAEARALLAEAYEAVSDAAGKSEVSFASPDRGGATRHFLRAAENDADDVCATSRDVSVSAESGTLDALAAARVVLCPAGEGGRSDALVVDAGVAAAVEWCRATELDRADASYAERLRAACAKHTRGFGAGLSDALLSPGGASAAIAWLEADKWAHAPEYVRPRPKYYYFYEMMREKIEAHYPALPPPVMDKLLATDADELDLLLQYPEAIRGQTEEYLQVLRERGAEALETYKTPTLTWDEVRALKGGDGVVGLGAAGETTGGESVVKSAAGTKKKNTMRRLLPSVAEEAGVSLEENADATRTVATSVAAPDALSLKSAKAKIDRAKAFAEAYGTPAVTHATNDENDPECVSDPDEPEEDTDRAAVGAGGDDGLTDLEKSWLAANGNARETRTMNGANDERHDVSGQSVFMRMNGNGDDGFGTNDEGPLAALPPDQFRARAARFPSTRKEKAEKAETRESPRAERARLAAARFAATEIKAMDEMD